MKVKMKTAMAGSYFSYMPGQVVDVKKEHGLAWVEADLAEAVEETKPKGRAKQKDADQGA